MKSNVHPLFKISRYFLRISFRVKANIDLIDLQMVVFFMFVLPFTDFALFYPRLPIMNKSSPLTRDSI